MLNPKHLCVYNSKILTRKEPPSSDGKTVVERLSEKNGDIQHSAEKLPNGSEPAPSKSTKTQHSVAGGFLFSICNVSPVDQS